MIFLFEVVCPFGHVNGASLDQYASNDPPAAWFGTVSEEVVKLVQADKRFTGCMVCGTMKNCNWAIIASAMKANSMAEARTVLESLEKQTLEKLEKQTRVKLSIS